MKEVMLTQLKKKYIYIYIHIVPNIIGLFLWCLMSLHNVSFILISYSLEREKLTP